MLKEDHTEDKVYDSPNDKYTGYCAEMAAQLARELNINFEIRPVKDGKYGSKDENDTWNGMVGELVRNVRISLLFCCNMCTEVIVKQEHPKQLLR